MVIDAASEAKGIRRSGQITLVLLHCGHSADISPSTSPHIFFGSIYSSWKTTRHPHMVQAGRYLRWIWSRCIVSCLSPNPEVRSAKVCRPGIPLSLTQHVLTGICPQGFAFTDVKGGTQSSNRTKAAQTRATHAHRGHWAVAYQTGVSGEIYRR